MTPNKKVLLNIWTGLKEKKGHLAVILKTWWKREKFKNKKVTVQSPIKWRLKKETLEM